MVERLIVDMPGSPASRYDAELCELRRELGWLRAENARLARLVGLVGPRPLPDEAARSPLFGGFPGAVNHSSSKADKVAFFRHLFAGRDDVHAFRWENDRTGRAGWMPAVEGGFRRGQTNRTYLPLTDDVITAHLAGTMHAGLYPLMNGDTCRLLACDFDGPMALLDALAYTKAARSFDVPTALEVSRSGSGSHVWMFFADVVAATTARRVGVGLLREAMAIRGELDFGSCCYLHPQERCSVCGVERAMRPWAAGAKATCATCAVEDHPPCQHCGLGAPVPAGDEAPRCLRCAEGASATCVDCGALTVMTDRDGKPRCWRCYRRPERRCGRCGRLGPIARLATGEDPELCHSCWTGPVTTCASYVRWQLLRRARATSRAGGCTPAQRHGATASLRAAQRFLDWLDDQDRTIAWLDQTLLDDYLLAFPAERGRLGGFLGWARRQRLVRGVEIRWLDRPLQVVPVDQDHRWALARQLLHDDTLPTVRRVATLLVVLFAQTPARIAALTLDSVTATAGTVTIDLGRSSIETPEPLAGLLRQHLASRTSLGRVKTDDPGPWLFPGRHPHKHAEVHTVQRWVHACGVTDIHAQRASALIDLAGQLPSPVVADFLGVSVGTAVKWSKLAGRPWGQYLETGSAMRRRTRRRPQATPRLTSYWWTRGDP